MADRKRRDKAARKGNKSAHREAPLRKAKDPRELYTVDLLIKHPTLLPAEITAALGMTPQYFWQRGELRHSPDGTRLDGVYPDTMWRRVIKKEGSRRFFVDATEFVEQLRPHREFFARLTSEGGRATLIIDLAGDVNMGDTLEPDTLRTISDLGIRLGVEVFPKWRRSRA